MYSGCIFFFLVYFFGCEVDNLSRRIHEVVFSDLSFAFPLLGPSLSSLLDPTLTSTIFRLSSCHGPALSLKSRKGGIFSPPGTDLFFPFSCEDGFPLFMLPINCCIFCGTFSLLVEISSIAYFHLRPSSPRSSNQPFPSTSPSTPLSCFLLFVIHKWTVRLVHCCSVLYGNVVFPEMYSHHLYLFCVPTSH